MGNTIAAISSSIGQAGIGIVRMSGKESIEICKNIFKPKRNKNIDIDDNKKLIYGHIYDGDILIDEVLVAFMYKPNTYTREDMVEIYTHGSIVSVKKVLNLLLKKGARLAERGEFTKRAFLNGRLDLSQAEAVIDLIKSDTEKAYFQSLNQLAGGLKDKINSFRGEITNLLALMELAINFSEDGQEEFDSDKFLKRLKDVNVQIELLINSANKGKIIRHGIKTAIIGKPNVGKSSLLNRLINENKAIVTEIPGTTRDVIEEFVNIGEVPIKIIDTAGIRETEDFVEKIGVEKSIDMAKTADLIIAVFDSSRNLSREDLKIIELIREKKAIVLLNKIDLERKLTLEDLKLDKSEIKFIETSVKDDIGISDLEEKIVDLFYLNEINEHEDTVINNVRHENLLKEANSSLNEAIAALEIKTPIDCVEVDLRLAWEKLGEITGQSSTAEDILDKIFSEFCIGK